MKFSISNIAWPHADREHVYNAIKQNGVDGVEIALTKIAPWADLNRDIVLGEKALIRECGLEVSSYQAIYFGCPHLQLFGEQDVFDAMLSHTRNVSHLAYVLSGGGVGVFGAPRNRLRGNLSQQEAFDIGRERLRLLAEVSFDCNFVLALEAAPQEYGGDFLENTNECADMVSAVNHPGLRLHLDTGCVQIAEKSDFPSSFLFSQEFAHVHLSMPYLEPISSGDTALIKSICSILAQNKYTGWLAIEMRETENYIEDILGSVGIIRGLSE